MAKIGDFGTGQIGAAALRYMSPEQVRRDPVDHRSDLFSLGAVFYEMLTRRAPFEGDSPEQIRENILRAEPPLPSKVNPHVPGALDALVLRMLAGRPDDRFTNARILLRDLQRVEEELGLRTRRRRRHQRRRAKRRRTRVRHARPSHVDTCKPTSTLRRYRLARHSTSARRRSSRTPNPGPNNPLDRGRHSWRRSPSCSPCCLSD